MPSRQEWPSRMCCRHEAMDLYMPGAMLEANFALDSPVSLALSHPEEESGTREVGQRAHMDELKSPLDTNPVPPPLFLTASKRKPKKVGQKWQAVHLAFKCVAAVRPKFPFWSSPCGA